MEGHIVVFDIDGSHKIVSEYSYKHLTTYIDGKSYSCFVSPKEVGGAGTTFCVFYNICPLDHIEDELLDDRKLNPIGMEFCSISECKCCEKEIRYVYGPVAFRKHKKDDINDDDIKRIINHKHRSFLEVSPILIIYPSGQHGFIPKEEYMEMLKNSVTVDGEIIEHQCANKEFGGLLFQTIYYNTDKKYKYNHFGTMMLNVRVRSNKQRAYGITVFVKDDGNGNLSDFTLEDLSFIFEYSQSHKRTKTCVLL